MSLNPESIDRHDPYVNDKFIDIFEQEDNRELARMFTVALPINDPAAAIPVVPTPPSGSTITRTVGGDVAHTRGDHDTVTGRDKDGDMMRVSYVQGVTQDYDTDAALIFRVTPDAFLMPIERVPSFIAWLQSRVAKHERGKS